MAAADPAAATPAPVGSSADPIVSLLLPLVLAVVGAAVALRTGLLRLRPRAAGRTPPPPLVLDRGPDGSARSPLGAAFLGLALAFGMLLAGTLSFAILQPALPPLPAAAGPDAPPPDLMPTALRYAAGYAGQALVAVLAVLALRRSGPRPPGVPRPAAAAGLGLAVLAVGWPMVLLASATGAALTQLAGGDAQDPLAHETLRTLVDAGPTAGALVLVGLVVLAVPVLEEILYRGFLLGAARAAGMGDWPAILLVSAIFALMHWDNAAPHAVLGLFVLGALFAQVTVRTGSLLPATLMHLVFNAGNVALAFAIA